MTLKAIKKGIKELDPEITPENPIYNAQLVMLSALEVGANADKVAKFTKLPRKEVRKLAKVLTKNKIWVKGKSRGDWFDDENGGVSFLLDSMVATGLLERVPEK